MRYFSINQNILETMSRYIPGYFLFIGLWLLPKPCLGDIISPMASQMIVTAATQTVPVAPDMLVTLNSGLRSSEGEFFSFIGENARPIHPPFWIAASTHVVQCSTQENGCRYDLRFSRSRVGSSTQAATVGLLDVRVTNLTDKTNSAVYWGGWRYMTADNEPSLKGILLDQTNQNKPFVSKPSTWDETSTWYFQNYDFIWNEKLVYRVTEIKEFIIDTYARKIDTPYQDVSPDEVLGWIQLQAQLGSKQSARAVVVIPYESIPLDAAGVLDQITLPSE